jgi:hypothetical protein
MAYITHNNEKCTFKFLFDDAEFCNFPLLRCELCYLGFTSLANLKSHLEGARHRWMYFVRVDHRIDAEFPTEAQDDDPSTFVRIYPLLDHDDHRNLIVELSPVDCDESDPTPEALITEQRQEANASLATPQPQDLPVGVDSSPPDAEVNFPTRSSPALRQAPQTACGAASLNAPLPFRPSPLLPVPRKLSPLLPSPVLSSFSPSRSTTATPTRNNSASCFGLSTNKSAKSVRAHVASSPSSWSRSWPTTPRSSFSLPRIALTPTPSAASIPGPAASLSASVSPPSSRLASSALSLHSPPTLNHPPPTSRHPHRQQHDVTYSSKVQGNSSNYLLHLLLKRHSPQRRPPATVLTLSLLFFLLARFYRLFALLFILSLLSRLASLRASHLLFHRPPSRPLSLRLPSPHNSSSTSLSSVLPFFLLSFSLVSLRTRICR